VCNFGIINRDNDLLKEGDRSLWYKVQPYLIGMLTAKGIPMLWQGQEFGENYYLPEQGFGRVMLFVLCGGIIFMIQLERARSPWYGN
jgi:hypothetical protein